MIIVIFFLVICIGVYHHYMPPVIRNKKTYDYAILLGCPSHNDGSYATSQIKRCELAIKDYQHGRYKKLVITGGAVKNKYIESVEMKRYILERELIPILCETRSKNTYENFEFSKDIIGEHSVLILTSGTHARRACAIARDYFSHYGVDYYYYARPRHIYREIGARIAFIKNKISHKKNS